MKRYLLFEGLVYYPDGGWNDLAGDFDTVEEAKASGEESMLEGKRVLYDWYQIVDLETGKEVKD